MEDVLRSKALISNAPISTGEGQKSAGGVYVCNLEGKVR
jgi:hypothetical protein